MESLPETNICTIQQKNNLLEESKYEVWELYYSNTKYHNSSYRLTDFQPNWSSRIMKEQI